MYLYLHTCKSRIWILIMYMYIVICIQILFCWKIITCSWLKRHSTHLIGLLRFPPHFLQWELLNVIIYRGMVLTNCNYCNENSRSSNIVQCDSFNISVSKYLFIFVICLDNYTCSLFVKKKKGGGEGKTNCWPTDLDFSTLSVK